jgi:hypothetical protein
VQRSSDRVQRSSDRVQRCSEGCSLVQRVQRGSFVQRGSLVQRSLDRVQCSSVKCIIA